MRGKHILAALGDSNTFGYDPCSPFGGRYPAAVRWTGRLEGWQVHNLGMNGLCIPAGVMLGDVWAALERLCPDVVTVMLGSNDLLQGASPAQAAARMTDLLRVLTGRWSTLLIAPPPMAPGQWVRSQALMDASRDLAGAYRTAARQTGAAFADAGDWGVELAFDGVHFTERGHGTFAGRLSEILTEYL